MTTEISQKTARHINDALLRAQTNFMQFEDKGDLFFIVQLLEIVYIK